MAKREIKRQMVAVEPEDLLELRKIKRRTGKTIRFLIKQGIELVKEAEKFCPKDSIKT